MAKVRSAKGAIVDFDLLKIKEQMASTPKAPKVKERENLIDRRLRRRVKKALDEEKETADKEEEQPVPEQVEKPVKKIRKEKK